MFFSRKGKESRFGSVSKAWAKVALFLMLAGSAKQVSSQQVSLLEKQKRALKDTLLSTKSDSVEKQKDFETKFNSILNEFLNIYNSIESCLTNRSFDTKDKKDKLKKEINVARKYFDGITSIFDVDYNSDADYLLWRKLCDEIIQSWESLAKSDFSNAAVDAYNQSKKERNKTIGKGAKKVGSEASKVLESARTEPVTLESEYNEFKNYLSKFKFNNTGIVVKGDEIQVFLQIASPENAKLRLMKHYEGFKKTGKKLLVFENKGTNIVTLDGIRYFVYKFKAIV